jgi:hypothetical protein
MKTLALLALILAPAVPVVSGPTVCEDIDVRLAREHRGHEGHKGTCNSGYALWRGLPGNVLLAVSAK